MGVGKDLAVKGGKSMVPRHHREWCQSYVEVNDQYSQQAYTSESGEESLWYMAPVELMQPSSVVLVWAKQLKHTAFQQHNKRAIIMLLIAQMHIRN